MIFDKSIDCSDVRETRVETIKKIWIQVTLQTNEKLVISSNKLETEGSTANILWFLRSEQNLFYTEDYYSKQRGNKLDVKLP